MSMADPGTLVPAYGRDYKSKAAVAAAWNAGMDFTICATGQKINNRDLKRYCPDCIAVGIRYKKITMKVMLRRKNDPRREELAVECDELIARGEVCAARCAWNRLVDIAAKVKVDAPTVEPGLHARFPAYWTSKLMNLAEAARRPLWVL